MKKVTIQSTLALAALLGASLTAAAQNPPQGQGQGQGQRTVQPGAQQTTPKVNPQDARMGRLSVQRFDRLGGTKIKTLEGKEIGQLEDVVLSPNG
jgi:hypothetical protein